MNGNLTSHPTFLHSIATARLEEFRATRTRSTRRGGAASIERPAQAELDTREPSAVSTQSNFRADDQCVSCNKPRRVTR